MGRSFTTNSGTKAAVLHKGGSSTANSGTQDEVLLGMNKYNDFPLLSTNTGYIWTSRSRSYGLDGRGSIPGGGGVEIFSSCPDWFWGPLNPL